MSFNTNLQNMRNSSSGISNMSNSGTTTMKPSPTPPGTGVVAPMNSIKSNNSSGGVMDTNGTPTYGYGGTTGKGVGYSNLTDEIKRTEAVINNRNSAGMDISDQLTWYKKLTGNNYSFGSSVGGSSTQPSYQEQGQLPPQGNFNSRNSEMESYYMQQVQSLQKQMEEQRLAQERALKELQDKMSYNKAQPNLGSTQVVAPTVDGQHNYNPSGNGTGNVLQQNNSINEALYRYLNGMWGGNF